MPGVLSAGRFKPPCLPVRGKPWQASLLLWHEQVLSRTSTIEGGGMKVSIPWIVLVGLSFALPRTAEKPKPEIPIIGETIDVRVVNVEAVVTAASGKRVPGLSTADF